MQKFVKFYDSILNSNKSSFVTVAISWLHVIRPNVPGYLDNVNPSIKLKLFSIQNIYRIIKYTFIYIFYFIKKIRYFYNPIKQKDEYEVLILSHCLNQKMINKNEDFYFGNLEGILKKKKIKVQKLFINHTNLSSNYLNLMNNHRNHFILEKYLGLSKELEILFLQLKEFFRLIFLNYKDKNEKKLLRNIYISLFDKQTTFALRMRTLIKNCLAKANPSTLIITYEGYAWERILINTSKEFNPKIKIIGYQHPLVSKKNHAMLRNIKGNYNPDILWAPGNRSYSTLIKSKKIKNIKIIKSGYLKKIQNYKKNTKIKSNCLVVPGATYSEIIKLFDFSIKCALQDKNLKLTFRLHPMVRIDKILKIMNLKIKLLPRNIKISTKSLPEDIKNNSFVLYTDSAAVIEATRGGNIPIYLNLNNKINNDPIYDYPESKFYVNTLSDFRKILSNLKSIKLRKIKMNAEKIFHKIYGSPNLSTIYKSLNLKNGN